MTKTNLPLARIGIDLGGTKTEAIVMDANGQIVDKLRQATPRGDYQRTLEVISALVTRLATTHKLPDNLPIGIGTPGAISLKTGLMMNCNSTCLNHQPLPLDLQALCGRAVRIANDADCFTLSEASDGAAKDAGSVFGVIIGTGVGGGIVVDKKLLQGVNAISGEWGHNPLPLASSQLVPPAAKRECFCGRSDCMETWLAGPGFEKSWQLRTGQSLTSEAIVALATKGDKPALALLDEYCDLLALGLSTIINVLDPACIVLGGGMSNIDAIYSKLDQYLPQYVFSDTLNTQILKANYGDASGVRGAAWLWPLSEIEGYYSQA